MEIRFLMGNEAIALGAIAAGVNLACGYPGTPSTEVLETISREKRPGMYVEWSVNEKAGLELAAGAAYSGARAIVTMKQVGLNVASDPLMSLAYIGVNGGMVVLVADDPGPISSQTEQDTRHFAAFSKLPCFDPSSVQEAYDMIQDAFELSERCHTPVLFRPTTRICHGYASIQVKREDDYKTNTPEGFIKDSSRWVIFPKLSNANHQLIEARNARLSDEFSDYSGNRVFSAARADTKMGVATHGVSFTYVMEALKGTDSPRVMKVSTPFPFPERAALKFLEGLDEVLCVEELDPVIERELIYVCGKYHLKTVVKGKLTSSVKCAGENSRDSVLDAIYKFMGWETKPQKPVCAPPALPVRPPVLCAGCPHRASFYAVKTAMAGRKCVFCGDIGCYTLGNAMPLDMVDTCLCMGAGVNIAQGIGKIDGDTVCFAFVGDSTFFASAITGVVNAVYNRADMVLIVLDNSTTAMTGHQPHPGTGRTLMGGMARGLSIENILRGIGLETVEAVNPLDIERAIERVKQVAARTGVRAIIFKSPCAAVTARASSLRIDKDKCVGCQKCALKLGCPAITLNGGKPVIDESTCVGCGLCARICPVNAIGGAENE